MNKEERKRKLLRVLSARSGLTHAEIVHILGVSRETVRKDLESLAVAGAVVRKKGVVRLREDTVAKRSIGRLGALGREERLNEICEYVRGRGKVRISTIAKEFSISPGTVRSDLTDLESCGKVVKFHGYAAPPVEGSRVEVTPASRGLAGRWLPIVDRALGHIQPDDIVYLDDSLFGEEIAERIDAVTGAVVVTSSLRIANIFSRRPPASEVFILPGFLESDSGRVRMELGDLMVRRVRPKKAFILLAPAAGAARGTDLSLNAMWPLPDPILDVVAEIYWILPTEDLARDLHRYSSTFLRYESKSAEIITAESESNVDRLQLPTGSVPIAVCGSGYSYQLRRDNKFKIGFSVYSGSTIFRHAVSEGIYRAFREHESVSLVTRYNYRDFDGAVGNMNRFVDEAVDLIVDYSTDYDIALALSAKCADADIPLVSVDMPVPGAVYYGANNFQAGRIAGIEAATHIAERFGSHIDRIIVLEKLNCGSICKQRVLGTLDALREHIPVDNRHVAYVDCSNGYRDYKGRLDHLLDRMKAGEKSLIVSFGEDTTLEVHPLLCSRLDSADAVMIGQNFTSRIADLMKEENSPLIGCVEYAQDSYGTRVAEIALSILNRQAVPQMNYTTHSWIPNPRRMAPS